MSKKDIYVNGKKQTSGLSKKIKLSEVGLRANEIVSKKRKEKQDDSN